MVSDPGKTLRQWMLESKGLVHFRACICRSAGGLLTLLTQHHSPIDSLPPVTTLTTCSSTVEASCSKKTLQAGTEQG